MGSSAQLITRISADSTPFTRAIGEVNQALDKAFAKANASSRGFQALGASLSSIGSTLTLGVTAPILAFGAAAVKAATDIDSLKRGLTTVTGSAAATEAEFRKLRETAKLPGIDFEQAVRGSIRLQTLGVSADKARVIMGTFGNALAAAGGTKADFGEIIRQLSQLSSSAKVTKENLDPIIDRVPAVAAIIREKFGPEALGDPAKTFEKLGISSQQLVAILTQELGTRVPKITGSAQSAFDSFSEAVNETAGRIGDKFLPSVTAALPKIEALVLSIGDAADGFAKLPPGVQDAALAITGIAVAAGPALVALGSVVNAIGALQAANITLAGSAATVGAAMGVAYLAFESYKSVKGIADSVERLGFQFEALTGQASQAKKDIAFLGTELKGIIPYGSQIADGLTKVRAELNSIGGIATSPLKGIAEVLRLAAEATEKYTGRSREMEAALKNNLAVNNQAATSENEAILRRGELEGQLKRIKTALDNNSGATDRLKGSVGAATTAISKHLEAADALKKAYEALGVANTTDAIGSFAKSRAALEVVKRAYENGEASSVDLQRATEALGKEYLKLIDGLGGIRPKAIEVGESFDFARERALLAIGDIQAAASGARNISLGQLIVPGDTGPTILDGSDAARSSQRNLELIRQTAQGATGAWTQTRTAISRQVSTITTDFSRAVADIITGASSAGEAFKRLGQSVAQSLIRTIVENGVNVAIKALGNLLNSLGGVGKAIGGIFGGGSSGGGFGGIGGGSGGGGGAVGSAAGAGITGIVGAVSGVVSAISGIVGNFQMAGMNKTLDLIEKESRFSTIHLLNILEKINKHLPGIDDINQRLIEFRNIGVKIEGGGGGGTVVNITVQGSLVGGPNVAAELSAMVVRNLKLQGI